VSSLQYQPSLSARLFPGSYESAVSSFPLLQPPFYFCFVRARSARKGEEKVKLVVVTGKFRNLVKKTRCTLPTVYVSFEIVSLDLELFCIFLCIYSV
jgi:hypothetical protein